MGAHADATPEINVIPADKKKILGLWKVAGYLAIITAIEFIFAFTLHPESWKYTRIIIFILLTIVKAYYIISEFMHLGHEVKALGYSIILPCVFLCWLILALLMEAQSIFDYLGEFWGFFNGTFGR